MSITSLILIFIIAFFGLALAGFLCWSLFRPLFGTISLSLPQRHIRRAQQRLQRADEKISRRSFKEALVDLRGAFVLSTSTGLPSPQSFQEHHQNVLSRCVLIAEQLNTRLENIARVEHLLLERSELIQLFQKVRTAFNNLASERQKKGKSTPEWSRSEYQNRLQNIGAELESNKKLLDREIETLFDSFNRPPSNEITYH